MDNTGKSILLAEDNMANQRLMEISLRRFGFPIVLANNGLEAVELYQAQPEKYILIFMDIMMPVMDGYEATQQIRSFEQGRDYHVPIIALTANTLNRDRVRSLSLGMDDYLAKPLNLDLLKQALLNLGIIT
jgi:CheY-like chemotaxis protein